jgi:hypothetical protein
MSEPTEPVAAEEELPQEEVLEEHELVDDPGQFEGRQEDKEKYSKRVAARINDLTKHRREAERDRDSMKVELEEANKKLSVQPAPPPVQEKPPEEPKKDVTVELNEKLSGLQDDMATALEELDGKKAAEVNKQINKTMIEMFKAGSAVDKTEITKAVREAEHKATVSTLVIKHPWLSEKYVDGTDNPNYDAMKANAVIGQEELLAKSWTGSYASRWEEAVKQVEERFSPQTPQKPKLAAVAGVTSVKKQEPANSTALTQIEKEFAYKMFADESDPEAVYAKYKTKGAN